MQSCMSEALTMYGGSNFQLVPTTFMTYSHAQD